MLWITLLGVFQLVVLFLLTMVYIWTNDDTQDRIRGLGITHAPTGSAAPSLSPTFIVPVVVLYVSNRTVPGDFALRETPESVCMESASPTCDHVSAMISTSNLPLRRRARGMKGAMVSFGAHEHNHIIAHDVADVWLGAFELGLQEDVWTGTDAHGGVGDERCNDWTSVQGYGIYGRRTLVDGDADCSSRKRLLCMCKSKL